MIKSFKPTSREAPAIEMVNLASIPGRVKQDYEN